MKSNLMSSSGHRPLQLLKVKEDLLCSICDFPITNARQCSDCGCRICNECYLRIKEKNQTSFECKRCQQPVYLENIFVDKAVRNEVNKTLFPCFHDGCTWKGSSDSYKDHISTCKFACIPCPHDGCDVTSQRYKLMEHTSSCPYRPTECEWCSKDIPAASKSFHEMNECPEYEVLCPIGCGEKIQRKMTTDHVENHCKLKEHPCKFAKYGCNFKGNYNQLEEHTSNEAWKHIELLEKEISRKSLTTAALPTDDRMVERVRKEMGLQILEIRSKVTTIKKEVDEKFFILSSEILKMEKLLQSYQKEHQDLALTVQVLQSTSYNGEYVWKVPEVMRRRSEAITGKTISLYSAPFYTSRFGYKLCLRLYMNGDGSGRGTHLSLFLTIMMGEYDAILQWPFSCRVTLMLLDQRTGRNHITDYFKPDPSSSSFWRPQSSMNIASGSPQFAPLSVFHSNSKYVVDDAMFFKAIVTDSLTKQ